MALSVLKGKSTSGEVDNFTSKNLLLHQIYEQLLKNPDASLASKCAVICRDQTMNFGELNAMANRLARSLSSRIQATQKGNFTESKLIGVNLEPNEHLIVTLLAILKCGGAYLPIDSDFPPARLHHILTEAKPLLVIRDSQKLPTDYKHSMGEVDVDYEDLAQDGLNYSSEDLDIEEGLWQLGQKRPHVACVLYTSGSTGIPKGVVIPHEAVLNRLQWQWRTFPFQDGEVCCFKTVLTFVDSVAEIFAPLLQGHTLVVIPRAIVQDPELLVTELDKRSVRRIALVQSHLRALLAFMQCRGNREKACATILPDLKLWVCSSEPIPERLLHDFFLIFPNGRTICNFYGSTEVMADVTYIEFKSIDDVKERVLEGKVPIGLPLDNTNIYLLDKNMLLVPLGKIGEVYVSGWNVAAGYLNKTTKTHERFLPNSILSSPGHGVLYGTGDLGRIINGLLYFEGRTDSQIKVRGHRVDLMEIQLAASQIPGISQAIALCYKPNEIAQTIVLFYLPTEDNKEINEAQVTSHLHDHLFSHMMPYVIKMDSIPLLSNEKMDSHSMIQYFEKLTSSRGQILLNLSGVKEEDLEAATALLKITATVIHNPSLGRLFSRGERNNILTLDANFYSIGGNSLNTLEVLCGLRDRGYHVSVADFLQAPTLRHVLQKLIFDSSKREISRGEFEFGDKQSKYAFVELKDAPQEEAVMVLALSFVYRAELDVLTGAILEERLPVFHKWWPALIEAGLSFVIKDRETEEIVAVAINSDANDPTEYYTPPSFQGICEFLEWIESPILQNSLPSGSGTVLNTKMVATAQHLQPAENVHLIQLVEQHNIEIATRMGYKAILTTNTSQLTKDICVELLGYKVFSDVQANSYTDKEGRHVFAKAPDDYHVYVTVKFLS